MHPRHGILVVACVLALSGAHASLAQIAGLDPVMSAPPAPVDKDLWIGGDVGLAIYPLLFPVARLDVGVGQRQDDGLLVAANLELGGTIPAWFVGNLLLDIGGNMQRGRSQPFYAFQTGVGLTVDSPLYRVRPTGVDPSWTKGAVNPSFIAGACIGTYIGRIDDARQIRFAVEPRFVGAFALYDEGTVFMPMAEIGISVGVDLL
jgi:hypothetical protein